MQSLTQITNSSQIGILEARSTLGKIVNRVQEKEELIYLTRNGKIVAVLAPPHLVTQLSKVPTPHEENWLKFTKIVQKTRKQLKDKKKYNIQDLMDQIRR